MLASRGAHRPRRRTSRACTSGLSEGRLLVAVDRRGVLGAARVRVDGHRGRVVLVAPAEPVRAGRLSGIDLRLLEVGEALCRAIGCERVESGLS